jgi:hypothetical protein
MTTATMKRYTLEQFNVISFNGFEYTIPKETYDMINYLTNEVGCPSYVKTPVFHKKINAVTDITGVGEKNMKGKKRSNKPMEISNDEWETIRNFQTTKLEEKTGIDCEIDQIRLHLNKMTDKTFIDMKNKIIVIINNLNLDEVSKDKISKTIYEISSSNKFYSKIYADVYAELVNNYEWLRPFFERKLNSFMDCFNNIEYCDPEKDYNKFCDMNKANEQRKAMTQFFINLCKIEFIPSSTMVKYLQQLLINVSIMLHQNEKKNEIDELTENIAIMFDKEIIENAQDEVGEEYMIGECSISEFITKLAKSKTKDYKSLSNKAIFKCMDLIDM